MHVYNIRTVLVKSHYKLRIMEILSFDIFLERCDPPLSPINGYFLITTNASVTFVCHNETQLHSEMATCSEGGVWEPDPRDYCAIIESDSEYKGTTCGKIHCLCLNMA